MATTPIPTVSNKDSANFNGTTDNEEFLSDDVKGILLVVAFFVAIFICLCIKCFIKEKCQELKDRCHGREPHPEVHYATPASEL